REILTEGTGRIVSEVAMNMPLRYYATRGDPNKDVRRPLKDYIQDEYQVIVPGSNSLEDTFVQALDPAAQSNQSDLRLNTAQAIDDVPDMSFEEETEYVQELALRQETNHWLSWGELMYRGDQLSLAQDRREAEEHDWFGKLISFFISMGLKVGAGAICDGPCVFLVSGVQTGVQAYLNEQAIEEDQRMRDLALNLMHMGYEVQAVLWSNTNAGLALVASKGTLETPSGSLDEIRLKRTTTPLGFERDVYAEVTISNPLTDSVTALYGVKAYYLTADGYLQVSQNTIDPGGEETRLLVELAPGESKTVRLYLCRHNEFDDGRPRRGDPIRFNLYAYTDKGVYLVDAEPHVDYEPEKTADLAAADRVSVRLLSSQAVSADAPLKLVATSGVSDTARFPLMTRIGSWPDSVTYTLAIYAENPWPGPIATVISQSIPSQVTVLDAGDGVVRDGAVVWHRIIQPRETVVSHVEFDYADYGVEATLPAATMQFYDPADDAMITLSSDPLTFQAKIPLRASADADLQVAPDSQQTVVATVTNVDSSSARQGDLVLHVWTITGTEVLSTTAPVSLGAGASQDYDLIYTAPDEGLYVLEVSLRYGDETTPVICDLLKVRENRVYLPVVLRNQRP
ncbi:MAG TPA: hypothetical protein VM366_16160, partial [Anaerolineae bacterium]|nr:hypothetical protein [Anaerolineae bacterium]